MVELAQRPRKREAGRCAAFGRAAAGVQTFHEGAVRAKGVPMVASRACLALGVLLTACRRDAGPPVSSAPAPDLPLRAETEAHTAATNGERFGDVMMGVSHEEDEATDFHIQLDAAHCYWFGYAGDARVAKFSLYIWDPSGKRLDSARGKKPQGLFTHCATQSGIYRLQGKVAEGKGHFAIVAYRTRAAGVAAAPEVTKVESPKADLAAIIEAQAAVAAPGAKRVGNYFAGSADSSDWFTVMEPGHCYWIIGAGESTKVKRLYVYLWDPKSHRITENRSESEVAMVGHCAKEPGMYKFQVKVESGKGEYKAGVFVK